MLSELRDIVDDFGGCASEAPLRVGGGAAAPAALVEAVDFDVEVGGELWEEVVVGVDVVAEAVEGD